jgi:tetratricopeptide (TPR) repeat protein
VERSLAALTETLRLDPKNVAARINRGMAYGEKGDYDRAIRDLTEALRHEPRNAQAYASRGVIHAQMRVDYAKGIADLTRAIQCAPDEVILYEFRAIFFRAVGDTARAVEDERKAAELRPRGTISNLRLGPAGVAGISKGFSG